MRLPSWALPVSRGMWVLLWVLPGRLWVLTLLSVPEEKFSAEVESWMTGEQYAAWILSARYCRGWEQAWGVREAVTSSKAQPGLVCRLGFIWSHVEYSLVAHSSLCSLLHP